MKKIPISIRVNGEEYDLYIPQNRTLLELLRDDLEMTGTKQGCGLGVCGSCTVLWNGSPIRSCLTLALEVEDGEITTVEGLRRGESEIDPIQQAFIEHGAVQCGFCTPGMIMTAKAFLEKNGSPDERSVREAISGNICRCTGYAKMVEAILDVAAKGSHHSSSSD
ncbi:MAG: (2Fe-2S)-binding protein [Deltaproteobacteria bacterium]|nr:(2Fe-2S)-binding protein [Deltaproteobacteria bacterium]